VGGGIIFLLLTISSLAFSGGSERGLVVPDSPPLLSVLPRDTDGGGLSQPGSGAAPSRRGGRPGGGGLPSRWGVTGGPRYTPGDGGTGYLGRGGPARWTPCRRTAFTGGVGGPRGQSVSSPASRGGATGVGHPLRGGWGVWAPDRGGGGPPTGGGPTRVPPDSCNLHPVGGSPVGGAHCSGSLLSMCCQGCRGGPALHWEPGSGRAAEFPGKRWAGRGFDAGGLGGLYGGGYLFFPK
jgi:hypothetical protein